MRFELSMAVVVGACVAGAEPSSAWAQSSPITVTLPEAIELAVRNSFAIRQSRIDQREADEQVNIAFASVLPRLTGDISYTRTIEAADPFAGSQAGESFGSLAALEWLQFNEAARTDADPTTTPITLDDFFSRQNAALQAAGIATDVGNPFLVENLFRFGLSLTQVIYDGAAFASLDASHTFKEVVEAQTEDQIRTTIQAVSQAFYSALLVEQRVKVLQQSVERAETNLDETILRVEQGVLPELQRLTAEVELANRKTTLIGANNSSQRAIDQVRRLLGLPGNQTIILRGALKYEPREFPRPADAVAGALGRRPDLHSAELNVRLRDVSTSVSTAELFPVVSLVANLSANGAIPDQRQRAVSANDPNDPFRLETTELGFFDDSFWFPVFNVGLQLEWTLFDGFGNYARIRQQRHLAEKARVSLEELRLAVQLEVEEALRTLKSTREQVETQERVRNLAERNYEQTNIRVQAGAGNQFELRQASQQLDESRFNYLQAIHDYLIAKVMYQVAVGEPPMPEGS